MPLDPIELALALPDAPTFEQAVLAGLSCEVGFDAAFVALPGETPTAVALDARQLGDALGSGRYDEETLPLKAAALRAHGVAVDTAVLGENRVQSMRYFRDFAAPIGGRHSLVAYLRAHGQVFGVMMLGRTGRTFQDREMATVRSLLNGIALGRASYGVCHEPRRSEVDVSIAGQLARVITNEASLRLARRDEP